MIIIVVAGRQRQAEEGKGMQRQAGRFCKTLDLACWKEMRKKRKLMILSMVCRDIEHGALVSCNGFMDLYASWTYIGWIMV